jgi:pimeloyl-ACP methyl ester carboxylesterase
MTARRRSRWPATRPALLAVTAAGGVAGVALAQRRYVRAIAADPELRSLSESLGGRADGPIISADGTRLYAERFGGVGGVGGVGGSGSPATLVLAHGWTERIDFWGPVIRRLAGPELTVLAYDLRGHGRSGPAAGDDYALERFGEDLEAVLVHSGSSPQRTAVAGHSLGAMSIAAWAANFDVTARISAAALVNTGLSELIGGALILGEIGSRLAPQWLSSAVMGSGRRMLPVSTPISHALTRHVAFGPDATDGAVAFYERMLLETEPRARAATGIALSTLDLSAAVAQIIVPTLVLAGDRDRLTPPAHSQRILQTLPRPAHPGLVTLARTGHMSPLERPEEVAGALRILLAHADVVAGPAAEPPR